MRPNPTHGLRHVALHCTCLSECVRFYTEFVGMKIEWNPDPDNFYLTSGCDNLALHKAPDNFKPDAAQRLDHFGFILKTPEDVDQWYEFFLKHQITIKTKPRTHRDGARSFYCEDPDGNAVQFIYHPPIAIS